MSQNHPKAIAGQQAAQTRAELRERNKAIAALQRAGGVRFWRRGNLTVAYQHDSCAGGKFYRIATAYRNKSDQPDKCTGQATAGARLLSGESILIKDSFNMGMNNLLSYIFSRDVTE